MEGDVIVFRKNGGSDTPVIHRALLKAIENDSGGLGCSRLHCWECKTSTGL